MVGFLEARVMRVIAEWVVEVTLMMLLLVVRWKSIVGALAW
jgi:hypothetical protein